MLWVSHEHSAIHVIAFSYGDDSPSWEAESLWAWSLTPGTYFACTYTLSQEPDGDKCFQLCGPIAVAEPWAAHIGTYARLPR